MNKDHKNYKKLKIEDLKNRRSDFNELIFYFHSLFFFLFF
jgi:hypothetical protein